jgi:hypothetical protein
MASKAPPVPPEQQSGKIRGASSPPDTDPEVKRDPAGGDKGLNLKEQDRYGGIHQNITHQGRQQDR